MRKAIASSAFSSLRDNSILGILLTMKEEKRFNKRSFADILWDFWCVGSIVGIWPRFVEPNLIKTSRLKIKIPNLPQELKNFTILQFSDLHFHPKIGKLFLDRLIRKVKRLKPDLIVFTGDFLCYSILYDHDKLLQFLQRFEAPYGCYAILGNHDYQKSVCVNPRGDYDILNKKSSLVGSGFKRLFSGVKLSKVITPEAKTVEHHDTLIPLLQKTPFELLNNQTKVIPINGSALNICGLGEYMLGRCEPETAYKNYSPEFPGIILAHNPDSISKLHSYPGEIILCGHTHGGQINLPFLWKKLMFMENHQYKRGLMKSDNKWIYINRGINGTMPFRWFSPPELLHLTLE